MQHDDFWITRFRDNRVRGVLQELQFVIEGCDDADTLHKLVSTLHLGFSNYAAQRERETRLATNGQMTT